MTVSQSRKHLDECADNDCFAVMAFVKKFNELDSFLESVCIMWKSETECSIWSLSN